MAICDCWHWLVSNTNIIIKFILECVRISTIHLPLFIFWVRAKHWEQFAPQFPFFHSHWSGSGRVWGHASGSVPCTL